MVSLTKLFYLFITFKTITCDESTHEYEDGESITVWVNKVGPFNNPTETYPYFKSHVPFCNKAEEVMAKHHEIHYSKFDGLGSLLEVCMHVCKDTHHYTYKYTVNRVII